MGKIRVPVNATIQRALTHQGQDTNFTTKLVELIAKADEMNRYRLRCAFPVEVAAYEEWFASRPERVPDFVDLEPEQFHLSKAIE